MAVTAVANSEIAIRSDARRRAYTIHWSGLAYDSGGAATVGTPYEWTPGVNRCVQVVGTFGSGGHVKMQGSNLESPSTTEAAATLHDWFLLTDPLGNTIDLTANGAKEITETPRWVRPVCTAGDGTTALDVYVNTVRSGGMP